MIKKLFAPLLILLIVSGCETLENFNYEPQAVIGVYRLSHGMDGKDLDLVIQRVTGKPIHVVKNPLLHSKHIEEVRIHFMEEKDHIKNYAIYMKLSRLGKRVWTQVSIGFRDEPLIFTIDGIFYKGFNTKRMLSFDEEEWVLLVDKVDESTALDLEKYSKQNFEHYDDM